MPFEAEKRYDGVIMNAGLSESKEKKTPEAWFRIKCEEGQIEHRRFLTPNTADSFVKTMQECFDISRKDLAVAGFFEGLGQRLHGAEVSIVTEAEKFKDKDGNEQTKITAKWMNPRGSGKRAASESTKSKVASLFGGASPSGDGGGSSDDWGIDDSNAPPVRW